MTTETDTFLDKVQRVAQASREQVVQERKEAQARQTLNAAAARTHYMFIMSYLRDVADKAGEGVIWDEVQRGSAHSSVTLTLSWRHEPQRTLTVSLTPSQVSWSLSGRTGANAGGSIEPCEFKTSMLDQAVLKLLTHDYWK